MHSKFFFRRKTNAKFCKVACAKTKETLFEHCIRAIKNAINKLTKNQSSLIIAHRLSTIKNCNYIICLNKGRIVNEGEDVERVVNEYVKA